jgi:hypothetical protein
MIPEQLACGAKNGSVFSPVSLISVPSLSWQNIAYHRLTMKAQKKRPLLLFAGCTKAIDPGLDKGCGRIMSDVSSMYITYVLELYKWQNDTATLHELWPVVNITSIPRLFVPSLSW